MPGLEITTLGLVENCRSTKFFFSPAKKGWMALIVVFDVGNWMNEEVRKHQRVKSRADFSF